MAPRARALADVDVIDPEGTLDVKSLANLIRDPSAPSEQRATAAWAAAQACYRECIEAGNIWPNYKCPPT